MGSFVTPPLPPPEGYLAIFGEIFGCHNSENATGILWVQARDAAKYSTVNRAIPFSPPIKSYLVHNINSVEVKKLPKFLCIQFLFTDQLVLGFSK